MNQMYVNNPELAAEIEGNQTFRNVAMEAAHAREQQAVRWPYIYHVSGTVAGQTTLPFTLNIEQGTDFKCCYWTGSMFSYMAEDDPEYVATLFPIPNALGAVEWAGRGLSIQITDAGPGRKLTSGYVPMELLFSPGYGMNFQTPMPFRYFFERTSQVQFDVRNRDAADREHYFDIALIGYKILTPNP